MQNFSYKLLQQLNRKRAEKGFTLIELLVVIIIIGILSAIALPAFLNQAAKARQSEAKQTLSTTNKSQQAYYLENQAFSPDIETLALGLEAVTSNYAYNSAYAAGGPGTTGDGSFDVGALNSYSALYANPLDANAVRNYAGGVALYDATGGTTSTANLCEEQDLASASAATFAVDRTATVASLAIPCPAGYATPN